MNKYYEAYQRILVATNGGDGLAMEFNTLAELIDKHTKPLKFEDLKEKMWVWDNKSKSYIYIFKPLNWNPTKGIRYAERIIDNSVYGYYMDFEENRFYLYQPLESY